MATDILKAAHLVTHNEFGHPIPQSEADIDLRWQFVHAVGRDLGYLPNMLHLDQHEAEALGRVAKRFRTEKYSVHVADLQPKTSLSDAIDQAQGRRSIPPSRWGFA